MLMLKDKYVKLLELINTDNINWVSHSGVPFVICTYDKKDHNDLNGIINKLKTDITNYEIQTINMEELIFNIIEENETIDGIIQLEKQEKDLNLGKELGELILEETREYFISKAAKMGKDGRLIVTRVGSTPVYFNFIRLLTYLEGRVKIPTLFFYPGSYDKFSVRLLDEYKETALRALII